MCKHKGKVNIYLHLSNHVLASQLLAKCYDALTWEVTVVPSTFMSTLSILLTSVVVCKTGVLSAHQAAWHIPALDLPSRSRYSFIDPERMEGWVSPGPGCTEQLAHGCYATARGQLDSNPRSRGRWSSALTTKPSRWGHVEWLRHYLY